MSRTPRLRTARLDLVPLRPAAAGEMVDVLADPALYAFIGGEPTIVAHVHPSHAASAAVARHAGLVPTEEIEDGERVWRWAVAQGA